MKYPFRSKRSRHRSSPFHYRPAAGAIDHSIHRKTESGCACHCHIFGDCGCESCALYHIPPHALVGSMEHTEYLGGDVEYGRAVPYNGEDFTHDISQRIEIENEIDDRAEELTEGLTDATEYGRTVKAHSHIGHMT